MLYRKQVSKRERVTRVAAGVLLAMCGLALFGPQLLGWVSLAAGVVTAATGLTGFCPACASTGGGTAGGAPRES